MFKYSMNWKKKAVRRRLLLKSKSSAVKPLSSNSNRSMRSPYAKTSKEQYVGNSEDEWRVFIILIGISGSIIFI